MSNVAEVKIKLSDGREAGKTINELTAQSVKLSREIKKLEVGSDEWIQKSQDFKKINTQLQGVRKEAFSTAEAQGFLNSVFGDMIPFQGEFGKLSQGIGLVGKSVRTTTGFFQLLKVAIAATGIGLLVVALGSLVTWLTKTQKGMDFVGKVTAAAGAAFQVIIDRVLTFGQAMVDIASGRWGKAVDGLKATFAGLGEEIKTETAAAYEMEGAMQDIIRAEKQLELQRSRSRAEIERLKMAAEDQSKSESERLAAAQKAFDLENALLNQSIELQTKKLNLIKEQNAQGTSTDEDLNREYDAEIELNNLREESFTKQTELQNKINALKQAGAKETKQLAEEEFFVVSENLEKEIAETAKAIERELKDRKEAEEEMKALRQQAIDDRLEQMDEAYMMEQMKLDEQFFNGQITEQERKELAFQQEKAFLEQRLQELAILGVTEQSQYQELYTELARLHYQYESEKSAVTEENEEKRKQLQREGLAAATGIFAGLATLLSQNANARKKNFGVLRAVQAAEIAANTATEISNIFKSFSSLGPLGQVLAVVQAAVAGARGAAALQRVKSVQISGADTFADGGVVYGPSHGAGGIGFGVRGSNKRFEMEGGEIIMTRGVYQDPVLRSLASDINVMAGGRSFALGGPVLQDRSMIPTGGGGSRDISTIRTQTAQAAGANTADFGRMEALLMEIVRNTRDTADKPPLALTEVEDGLKTLQNVRQDAQF